MDTWVSTRLLVEYAFWSFNFYVCIYFIFRILETSQRLLHLIAQPWNWSLTSLMLTATWHTAYRCSSAVILHLSIFFFFFYFCCYQNKFSDYFLLLFLPPTFSDCVWLDRLWWADEKACEHCGRPTGEEPLALSAPTPQHAVSALSQLPQGHCWAPRKPLPGQGRQNDQSK